MENCRDGDQRLVVFKTTLKRSFVRSRDLSHLDGKSWADDITLEAWWEPLQDRQGKFFEYCCKQNDYPLVGRDMPETNALENRRVTNISEMMDGLYRRCVFFNVDFKRMIIETRD